jgi:hypothetical protein
MPPEKNKTTDNERPKNENDDPGLTTGRRAVQHRLCALQRRLVLQADDGHEVRRRLLQRRGDLREMLHRCRGLRQVLQKILN